MLVVMETLMLLDLCWLLHGDLLGSVVTDPPGSAADLHHSRDVVLQVMGQVCFCSRR